MIRKIEPHKGPQRQFLASSADITIFGGAAGGGKSYGLCLECLRYIHIPTFGAVIFRRNARQVIAEGGLWHRSMEIFPHAAGEPYESKLQWRFPSGARVSFAHMEHEKDKFQWDGTQIPLICFDELIHFTESQFTYMLSRNRSTCGVKPYIRATTNPDAESWVADFIRWWIDQETGFPIKKRCGKIRYFYRREDTLYWYNSKQEAMRKNPNLAETSEPKSVTFIAADIYDNPSLLKADSSYLANLQALSKVERERLFKGNWKIMAQGGKVFHRDWFKITDAIPADKILTVRYWDKAATVQGGCETAGVKMSKLKDGRYIIEDVVHGQWSAFEREKIIRRTAENDGHSVKIYIEQEPGSGGKESAQNSIRNLEGYDVRADRVSGDKVLRADPFSAQAEASNVLLFRASWNRDYLDQLHAFPDLKFKDMVDASSGAFNVLVTKQPEDWGSLFKVVAHREDSLWRDLRKFRYEPDVIY